MFLLPVITAVAAFARLAAAEVYCCGTLGDYDEKKAWAVRESFCQNPRAHESAKEDAESYLAGQPESKNGKGYDRYQETQSKSTYFYGRVENGADFNNCWRATEELITKCARDGKAHGSWREGNEAYGMTLTGEVDTVAENERPKYDVDRRRHAARAKFPKRSLDELRAVSSEADLYNLVQPGELFDVDGEDIEINIVNTIDSLPRRDLPDGADADGLWRRSEGLATTEGLAHHWNETFHADVNLADLIRRDLRRLNAEKEAAKAAWNFTLAARPTLPGLQKRGDEDTYEVCAHEHVKAPGGGAYTWTVIQAGNFLRHPIPTRCVGQEYLTWGMRSDILKLQETDEVCESYSIDMNQDALKHLVRQFARSQGIYWKKCWKSVDLSGSRECADKWRASKGKCSRERKLTDNRRMLRRLGTHAPDVAARLLPLVHPERGHPLREHLLRPRPGPQWRSVDGLLG